LELPIQEVIAAFHSGHPRGAAHTKNDDRSELSLSINTYGHASALLTKAQQVLKKARRSKESLPMQ
jgi:ATP adenylyltransferase/5',5'''-P-1,P-4-tetraphosphate phosphorylase II